MGVFPWRERKNQNHMVREKERWGGEGGGENRKRIITCQGSIVSNTFPASSLAEEDNKTFKIVKGDTFPPPSPC